MSALPGVFLLGFHKAVADHLYNLLSATNVDSEPVLFTDFHANQYVVKALGTGEVVVGLSFSAQPPKSDRKGMLEAAAAKYGKVLSEEDIQEHGLTCEVAVLVAAMPEMQKPELSKQEKAKLTTTCESYASLYYVVMSYYFKSNFEKACAGETIPAFKIDYRPNEGMYIRATKDNLQVYTSIYFDSPGEFLFGRIFLQEFFDCRRNDRSLGGAPGFMMGERPAELEKVKGVDDADKGNRLWCTITLQHSHMNTAPDKLAPTVEKILNFRNYVVYHIRCSSTFMNQKMRARHAELLKVLARAKTDQTGQAQAKIS